MYSSSVLANDTGAYRNNQQTLIGLHEADSYMPEIGYLHVEYVLQLLCNTKVIHNPLGLFAKVLVDLQSVLCVDLRHLEIVLWS